MKKEYDLKKLRAKTKPRDPEKFKDLKVAINVRLDASVVAWLRDEAEKSGVPYQTLLNSKLKQSMSAGQGPTQGSLTLDQIRDLIRTMIREELSKVAS